MQSFLVISTNEINGRSIIDTFCQKEQIDPLDITYFQPGFEKKKVEPTLSFGIEAVREIQKKVFLKPHRGTQKAIVILQAEALTLPAQNAFLKILEEPPAHTILFLLSTTPEALLPTIRSRCLLMQNNEELVLTPKELEQIKERLSTISTGGISSALKHAELLSRDAKKAVRILEHAIIYLRQELLKESNTNSSQQMKIIEQFAKTHTVLKLTNTNPRLALEHALLMLCE
jgi:DNA polymerase-3 subunit delta'